MGLNVYPGQGMWKADILEAAWVTTIVFSPSKFETMVPPLDLVLVYWQFLLVGYFHSDSVVAFGVTVKYLCGTKMCFFAKFEQSDWLDFFCITIGKKVGVFGGSFIISILSLIACLRYSSVVIFGKANDFGIYCNVSVILTLPVSGM